MAITTEAMADGHRYVMGNVNAYCPACSVGGITALDCDHDVEETDE